MNNQFESRIKNELFNTWESALLRRGWKKVNNFEDWTFNPDTWEGDSE